MRAFPFTATKAKIALVDMAESLKEEDKKKKSLWKYFLYIFIVLEATALSLFLSLKDNFDTVVDAFAKSDVRFILLIVGLVALTYCIEGLIILVFCRLYTRHYKYHQGVATALIGQFYSDVTPGASGGQVMQVYTMKSQGVLVSNAASIMVMSFIIYQSSLIVFDVVAIGVEWNTIMSIDAYIPYLDWSLPMWPVILLGFGLNLFVILLLFTMSYSHKFHNFILHYGVGFLGKIRLLKNPDQTRENLRVQVENFKIELRRLQSNIPVLVLQSILFISIVFIRNSIPYFSGLALHAFGEETAFAFDKMMHASFLGSFHQMVTGLIPLPGSAGVSELFYYYLFLDFFGKNPATTAATQILWRTATFHIVMLVTGFVAAFYRSRPKEGFHYANRRTFVTLQLETYDERKRSSDAMYETTQLSRKEIQRKLREAGLFRHKNKHGDYEEDDDDIIMGIEDPRTKKQKKAKPIKPPKAPKKPKRKKKKCDDYAEWDL